MRWALAALLAACARAPEPCAIQAPPGPVGFDAAFTLQAVGCGEGELTWRQVDGPTLPESSASGRSFSGRTHRLEALRPGPLPWGIVPLSPATQGAYTIEATWRGERVGRVRVLAAARATGVPSLAVGAPVLLGGEGWRVAGGPPGASLEGGVFTATRAGRWQLVDGSGRTLGLRANRHDDTPLDCGRAECHPRATEAAKDSPMTQVLQRGLEGLLGDGYDARCALACHAVGEPGVPDGGFADVAARLGFALPARARWADVPRPLRRLGGVGCTACHGPAAIPEEGARWSILRADVCAVCHDAPPRYAVVAGWRASRMARSDAAPGTGGERCRDCHTTGGFLARAGIRPLGAAPPEGVPPGGIACAACHAAHGAHGPRRLLRAVGEGESGVCLACHAPIDDRGTEGAAGVLWRGAEGLAPHAKVPCIGCHDAVGHTFKVRPETCVPCHEAPPAVDGKIAGRAAELWTRLGGTGHHPAPRPALTGARARAAWNVSLVLEDPAAAVHNAPYARALLDEAERAP